MSENIKNISSAADFDATVQSGVVLVDFWAPWCGPCRSQLPILTTVADKFAGQAVVAKVNVDEQQDLAVKFNVSSIPALFLFKNGKTVNEFVGLQTAAALETAILAALS